MKSLIVLFNFLFFGSALFGQGVSPSQPFRSLFGAQGRTTLPIGQGQSRSQSFNSLFGWQAGSTANWGLGPALTAPKGFEGEESELREFVSRVVAREMLLKHFTLSAREEQANLIAVISFEKNGKEAVVHISWRDLQGAVKALSEGRHKNGDFREAARRAATDSARQMGRVVQALFIPDLP